MVFSHEIIESERKMDKGLILWGSLMFVGFIATIGITQFLGEKYEKRQNEKRQEKFQRAVNHRVEIIKKHYDQDKNGSLNNQEGAAMAKTFRYNGVLPSGDLTFQFSAGDYSKESVLLKITNQESYSPVSGPITSEIEIPYSTLDDLAKKCQEAERNNQTSL